MSYLPFDQSNLAIENGGNLASIATTDIQTMRLAELELVETMQAKMIALIQSERSCTGSTFSSRDCREWR